MTAAGIDLLSGGRGILGLGASGPQVIEGFHGVAYDAPIGRTREIIEICRKVWRREVVEHDGKYYKLPLPPEKGTGLGKPLKMITHPVRDRIPIYVASLGPKNVEMTAEVADGWIPTLFWPERAGDVWGESLAKGAANRAADLGPLETVAGGPVAIGEGLEHLRDRARPGVALYVGGMGARDRNFYNQLFRRYGFEKEADEIQELYLAGKKEEAAAAVPQEFLDATSLIGPAAFVKERIEAYKAAGVTILNASPMGGDTAKTLEQVKAWAS
jgi:F420-dependent oxidoreductase-like protein